MPELDVTDPHRAGADRRWNPAVRAKDYAYQGHGFDVFDPDPSEIPAACTCTWSWGPPGFRWERIGVKEDCPWHRVADMLTVPWSAEVRQP